MSCLQGVVFFGGGGGYGAMKDARRIVENALCINLEVGSKRGTCTGFLL